MQSVSHGPFHRAHLTGLLIFLLSLIITLQIVYRHSENNQGLATATENIHYFWTYGPTAIFSILAVFWGRLEYDTRVLMPWKLVLSSSCKDASKRGLVLDYISPNPITVLWASAQARDWPIFITALGSQLITAVTVISTGLFVLKPTLLNRYNTVMHASARFDTSSLNTSLVDGLPILVASSFLAGNLSVTYPPNTNEVYAIEPFNALGQPVGLEISKSANVTAFSADLDCQLGYVSNATMNAKDALWEIFAAFSNSGCTTEEKPFGVFNQHTPGEKGYIGTSVVQTCAGDSEDQADVYLVVASAQAAAPANLTMPDYAGMAEASDYRLLQLGSFELNATVLFCKPSSKLENAFVYLNSSNSILNISTKGISGTLPLPTKDLAEAFNNSLSAASNAFIATSAMVGRTEASSHDILFEVLISISSERDSARYMDAKALEADTRKLFSATWAQLASQYLLSAGPYDLGTGIYSARELRLVLRPITLYLLDGGLVALAICTSIMLFVRTTSTGTPDLPTLGRVATILAANPELINACSVELLRREDPKLSYSVASQVVQDTEDAVAIDGNPRCIIAPQINRRTTYWRPLAMLRWFQIIILTLPIAIIGIIEATYRISSVQQGLGDLLDHEYLHYTWTLVPALIMTLVKLLGQTMAFSVELLDSYLLLRLGNSPGNRTLFRDYLSGNSLTRCYHSVRSKRFAVFSISLVTLLSPFLTIVVSGLFDTQSIPRFRDTKLDVADRVDSSMVAVGYNNMGTNQYDQLHIDAANLLVQKTVPYPAGCFENFVLPNLVIPSNLSSLESISNPFNTSSISVRMKGLQMRTDCEIMDQSEFVILSVSPAYGNYTHPVLAGCSCVNVVDTSCHPSHILSLGFGIPDVEYATKFYAMRDNSFDPWTTAWLNPSNWSGPALPVLSSQPCPNITIVYGTRGPAPELSLNMTGIACYVKAAEVNVNVSYTVPQRIMTNVSVISSSPDVLDNSFWYANPKEAYTSINDFIASRASEPYDNLAMAALNGTDIDSSELFTPSNAPVLADRVSHIYTTFLTQFYSQILRNATFEDDQSREVPAVLVDENRQRLVQNRLSTSILEGLLAVIWLCTVAAILLSRTKNLLPENPCSIAAQARLFADSQLLSLIPGDIANLTNKQLARETPFVDHMFSLGWWEVDGKGTRRFGIDVGKALFD